MPMPRVIIADPDINYLLPLQQKFAEEYWNRVDLEVINNKDYFDVLFSTPQKIDILIVSENYFDRSLLRHNINNIFLMSEKYEEMSVESNITKLFKYKNIKEIFSVIIGRSNINPTVQIEKATKIIYVCSAQGGAGKTALSMAIGLCLENNYKKVLYINASYLHTFQYMLNNKTPVSSPELYASLSNENIDTYPIIRRLIRKEGFSYLPPFKAALISLGISFSIYEKIILSAKESNEFDFIIVDSNASFDEENARLLSISDKVIVITEQSYHSVLATNIYVSNLSDVSQEKYLFVCNKYERERDDAMTQGVQNRFTVFENVWRLNNGKQLNYTELAQENEIRKIALMLV